VEILEKEKILIALKQRLAISSTMLREHIEWALSQNQ
jgi:epoxyqueuosine reductase QueG